MNMERPGSPSATTVVPASKRRSTSIEMRRSRLASERPPKKGGASKNAFRSGELTAIHRIYSRFHQRQAGHARRNASAINTYAEAPADRAGRLTSAASRRSVCDRRQGELKAGAVGYVCAGPQTSVVRFNDRPADRQPKPQTARFRG